MSDRITTRARVSGGSCFWAAFTSVERPARFLRDRAAGAGQDRVEPAQRRVDRRVAVEPLRERRDVGRVGELVAQRAGGDQDGVGLVERLDGRRVVALAALSDRFPACRVVLREQPA